MLTAAARLCLGEQSIEIKRAGKHLESPIGGSRPLVRRTVPIKFDAVFVRIAQIKRFAHPVVGRAIELDILAAQALERVG